MKSKSFKPMYEILEHLVHGKSCAIITEDPKSYIDNFKRVTDVAITLEDEGADIYTIKLKKMKKPMCAPPFYMGAKKIASLAKEFHLQLIKLSKLTTIDMEKNFKTLEVGCEYRLRNGEKCKILKFNDDEPPLNFKADNDYWYTKEGYTNSFKEKDQMGIVAKITKHKTSFNNRMQKVEAQNAKNQKTIKKMQQEIAFLKRSGITINEIADAVSNATKDKPFEGLEITFDEAVKAIHTFTRENAGNCMRKLEKLGVDLREDKEAQKYKAGDHVMYVGSEFSVVEYVTPKVVDIENPDIKLRVHIEDISPVPTVEFKQWDRITYNGTVALFLCLLEKDNSKCIIQPVGEMETRIVRIRNIKKM